MEYDESPAGPYFEVVDMGSLVIGTGGALGQYGSKLCVSSKPAEVLCKETWAVPAEFREIQFESGVKEELRFKAVGSSADSAALVVNGWKALRIDESPAIGITVGPVNRLPLWWTPQIKGLWLPFRLGNGGDGPFLHDLRLSAERLALQWRWPGNDAPSLRPIEGFPIPFSILADGVTIEIWPKHGRL